MSNIKKISLGKGSFVVVDAEDYEYLSQWKWKLSTSGYACRIKHIHLGINKYKGKVIWMHRLLNNTPEDMITDHINRNKLDNRICNLRDVNSSTNRINIGLRKNNNSGITGVCWIQKRKKWQVQISINKQCTYIGLFKSLKEAKLQRKKYELLYY